MENLPVYITIGFILTTLVTVFFFYKATNYSKLALVIIACWLIIQGIIAMTGFYTISNTTPPTFSSIRFTSVSPDHPLVYHKKRKSVYR